MSLPLDCFPFDPLAGPPPPIAGGGGPGTPSTSVQTYTLCDPVTGDTVEVRYLDSGTGVITGPLYFDPSSGAAVVPNLPLIDCTQFPRADCQQGCDYAPLGGAIGSGAGNLPIQFVGYNFPGDSRFELRIDFVNSPGVFAQLQAWILGGIQEGDFWFMDTTWVSTTLGIPSVSTGAGLLIGEWMLASGTVPDIVGTQIRFLIDVNVVAPCDLAQFNGFTFDVADISNAWLYAQAMEVQANPNWVLGSINANAVGASFLSRPNSRPIPLVKLCAATPVRVDQQPVGLQYDIRDISGQIVNLDTLDATSITLTVIAGPVLAYRGSFGSPGQVTLPAGFTATWGIDAARGVLANIADNAVAATERGFTVDATAGTAIIHWTWQVAP